MHVGGGMFHLELSYKQLQDLLSARDLFSRMALDLGPDLACRSVRVPRGGVGRGKAVMYVGLRRLRLLPD